MATGTVIRAAVAFSKSRNEVGVVVVVQEGTTQVIGTNHIASEC